MNKLDEIISPEFTLLKSDTERKQAIKELFLNRIKYESRSNRRIGTTWSTSEEHNDVYISSKNLIKWLNKL